MIMGNKEAELRTVEIGAMSVLVFHGYGKSPEELAFGKLAQWVKTNDAMSREPKPRIFGFNNPNPSPGSEQYGYDFWLEVPDGSGFAEGLQAQSSASEEDDGPVVHHFDGGLYAALHHEGTGETIPGTWKSLVEMVEQSAYAHASHQWLEEHFVDFRNTGDVLSIDCLMPIAKGR
jgi:DNA gyrase inhibitor GyrI